MESFRANIQLMLVLLRAPHLVLRFNFNLFYLLYLNYWTSLFLLCISDLGTTYTPWPFLTVVMMLFVIYSYLITLLFALSVSRLLINLLATTRIGCWTWICPTRHVDWGGKWLVGFIAGKSQLSSFSRWNKWCCWYEDR